MREVFVSIEYHKTLYDVSFKCSASPRINKYLDPLVWWSSIAYEKKTLTHASRCINNYFLIENENQFLYLQFDKIAVVLSYIRNKSWLTYMSGLEGIIKCKVIRYNTSLCNSKWLKHFFSLWTESSLLTIKDQFFNFFFLLLLLSRLHFVYEDELITNLLYLMESTNLFWVRRSSMWNNKTNDSPSCVSCNREREKKNMIFNRIFFSSVHKIFYFYFFIIIFILCSMWTVSNVTSTYKIINIYTTHQIARYTMLK